MDVVCEMLLLCNARRIAEIIKKKIIFWDEAHYRNTPAVHKFRAIMMPHGHFSNRRQTITAYFSTTYASTKRLEIMIMIITGNR